MWITNGGFADILITFAQVDGDKFTCFIIDADSEGFNRGEEENKLGIKGSSTRALFLDNVKVPVENILGEIGKGHYIAFNILNVGRFKLCAMTSGSAKKVASIDIAYANERKQFGQPISGFGAIKHKIAEQAIRIFVSESATYRVSDLISKKIKELKSDGIKYDLKQVMYTSNKYLPTPFGSARYHHRPIDIAALVETGFTTLPKDVTVLDAKKVVLLPKNVSSNFIKMEEHHVPEVMVILNSYFDRYTCHPIFDESEFKHIFLNNSIVTSYVVIDDGKVVDFISYYKLPSKVLNPAKNKNYPVINTGYLFYYTSTVETIFTLINNMMIVARNEGIHVFNALDIMENGIILKDLKFEEGTGRINYYMYNYSCMNMSSHQIAKILL